MNFYAQIVDDETGRTLCSASSLALELPYGGNVAAAKKVGEALAEKADIHPNYVGRIERGECSASVGILLRLAKALGVRPYKFFLRL